MIRRLRNDWSRARRLGLGLTLGVTSIALTVTPNSVEAAPEPVVPVAQDTLIASSPAITSISPERLADTRAVGVTVDGEFQSVGQRAAGTEYKVPIADRGSIPAAATGVIINVTSVNPFDNGFFTVHPCATPRPTASALNYTAGVNVANEVVASLSDDGSVCVFTSAASHLLIDVVGYTTAGSSVKTLSPKRYADSRSTGTTFDGGSQAFGRADAGSTTTVRVAGRGGVPADVTAVIINVAVVGPRVGGYATVHPCLATTPNASSINYVSGVNRANELVARVDSSGDVCIFAEQDLDLIVDVVGYVESGSDMVSLDNARFVDTRATGTTTDGRLQRGGKRTAGSTTNVPIAGRGDVPAGAVAAIVNIAAVQPDGGGFFTVDPCGDPRPNASSLNYTSGVNGANELIAPLDAAGELCVYTSESTHFILDVVGYVAPNADLSITKTDDIGSGTVVAGDTITYTVAVANNGSQAAEDVVVTDSLPNGVTLVSTSGCAEDPSAVPTCTLGDIAAGGTASYTVAVTVDFGVPEGTITNTATVDSGTGDPNADNNSATADTDVVKKPPTITSDGGGATASRSVAENQTAVTDVESSDPEGETEGAGLTYSLTTTAGGGVDNGRFTLNPATGVVAFTAAPDFETPADANADNAYEVQVTVTDSDALTDTQDITVTVTNVIDVAPVITSNGGGPTAAVSVEENQVAVTDVQSLDGDGETENGGGLVYSLTKTAGGGADNGRFTLNPATGVIVFTAAPDFEAPADANADNAYQLQVTVTDGAGLTDVQDITVSVTNVNDVAPRITSNGGGATATVLVRENQAAVTDVESVDDADTEGAGLTYSLTTTAGGGVDNGLFTLDPVTGVLTFTVAPNFENPIDLDTDNRYEVQVTVTDSTGFPPGLTDLQDITVRVTNVNEAPTIFSDGGGDSAAISVAENQTAVTNVESTDPDGDVEGRGLTYSLTTTAGGGVDNGRFTLNTVTGVVSFTSAPNFENPLDADSNNAYELQVTVTDSGGLTDVQDITVSVTDGNEVPTIVSDGGGDVASLSVPENTAAVTDVDAIDDADAEGAGLTYSLSPTTASFDNLLFTVGAEGALSFTAAPDFENPRDANRDNVYVVQVTVTDSGGLTDSQYLVIRVTNVIDVAPVITSNGGGATAAVTVAENAVAVTDVQSVDGDGETENGGGLVYSLTTTAGGGADNGRFTLDPATGVIVFTVAPDFEAPADANTDNAYQLQVTVTDGAALTDVQDITVSVTNVNDAAPTITSDGGEATAAVNVAENQTAVTDVDAIDDVDAEGAGLTYSLTTTDGGGVDNAKFSVNATTGVLVFNVAPDFEMPGDENADNAYEVQVTVTDGAALTDLQDITATVTNENEAPTFTSAAAATVPENQTAIIDVNSIDETDSEGSGLTYSLTTAAGGGVDNGRVTLAPDGTLTFTVAPDFETPGDANADNIYAVQVTVTDSDGLTAVQNIAVTVTNLNDNAPTITSAPAVNAPENQTIATDVNSFDADGETENGGGLTYSLTANADGGVDNVLFNLNPATGLLTFVASPDFENPGDDDNDNDYQVQVTVTDSGLLTGSQDLTVTVTGANDAPVITSAPTADAPENQTAAIDVQSFDQDGGVEGAGLVYSFTRNAGGGIDNGLFALNPATGVVTFRTAPDFENPSDANRDNRYVIQVTVTDGGGLTATQNIIITVTDVNEAPTITSPAAVDAPENQTAAVDVQSTDPEGETENGGGLEYSFTTVDGGGVDNGSFDLDTATGEVTFIAAPDFEAPGGGDDFDENNAYEVQVTVTDSGSLTDTQNITVTVTNVNESPTITSGSSASVEENETDEVIDVESTDPDGETENGGGLTYSFTTDDDGGVDNGAFTLDPDTGVLAFDPAPDFEVPTDDDGDNVYEVQVTVTDSGSLTDTQNITVTVTALNDSAPQITSDGGEATASVEAAENQTEVTDVESSDPDGETEDGGGLTYSLTINDGGGADNGAFNLDLDTGEVTFNATPDFEAPTDGDRDNVYQLQVTVTDGAGSTDVQDITVSVTNENDNAPEITSDDGGPTASVDAAENQTAVTDVESSDADGETEDGGGLTYSLTTVDGGGADNGAFTLDTDTGELTFTVAPDFEAPGDNVYDVQVTVTDGADATDRQDIAVTVTDDNDAPTITSDGGEATAALSVQENEQLVTDVDSIDQDGDSEGSGLTYALTTTDGGGVDNGAFTVNPNTGELIFTAEPDFEAPTDDEGDADSDNVYEVQVTVTDSGSLTDVQDISVTVTNVNDVAPVIISDGGEATASVDAVENQTAVTDVDSSDADGETEDGGGLTYALTTTDDGGVDNGLFTLDSDTGELTFTTEPDFEAPGDDDGENDYEVQVTVTDTALLTDLQDITVTVTNANDNAPEITSDGGEATASVDAAENQTVVTDVQSTDPDGDVEGFGLTYSFTTAEGGADNDLFTLNTTTGVLSFTAAPDFEDPDDSNTDNDYEVQVTVTDSGLLTDTQDISVTVTNENDVAPVITSDGGGDTAAVNAAENQTTATDVDATDVDGDSEGAGLSYSLTTADAGGVDNDLFTLDSDTGELTFNDAPDFEAPGSDDGDNAYEVQVTVTDSGLLTDTQDITVTVTDGNDAPTIISSPTLTAAENQTAVIDIESTDDFDSEGEGLLYSFTTAEGGADNDLFTLNTTTGLLSFTTPPDFEDPGDANTDNDYEVQVTVTDAGSLTDTQNITVSVTNEIDVAPEIISDGGGDTAAVDAPENQTFATDVESTDADGETEDEGGLTYSLTTVGDGAGVDNGLFTLDSDTGELTFNDAPDFEAPGSDDGDNDYEVQVTVTDSAFLTDMQDITVTVTDGNDAPTITSAATANAVENQTAVMDVQSTDDFDSEGAGLLYSFTTVDGGADNGKFTLNPTTGLLTFSAAPNFEAPGDAGANNVYDVQVTVTDSGFLTDTQDIAVTVTDGNDAPTMTPAGPSLPGTGSSTTSTPQLVSTLISGSSIVDADAGSTLGIAITGSTGAGIWQYSINGTNWFAIGNRTNTSARVLRSTAAIRYIAPATAETATLTYRAWDTTNGSANGAEPVNTVPNGTTTAFSSNTDTAQLAVTIPSSITEIIDSTGDGAGNSLTSPYSVAVDGLGNAFVAGIDSNNVFKVASSTGVVTKILDASGDGVGNTLAGPAGVAVDGSGNVYVTGLYSNNVFKVASSTGVVTKILDSSGDGVGNTLWNPFGVAVDGSGNVYVTGYSSNNVFKVTPLGVVTKILDSSGDGVGNTLAGPRGVAVDGSGNVYVTGGDSNNVFKVTPLGVVTKILDSSGDGVGNTLAIPLDVAVDGSGNVYVTGLNSNNVFKVTPAGVVTQVINGTGDGTGNTLVNPYGVAVDGSGNVYVAGINSNNVFKLTSSTGVVTEILDASGDGAGNTLAGAYAVAVGGSGNVYVTGINSNNVFRL